MSPALLVLEDGRVFRGARFGALTDAAGEVVFNTSMTGYQEILGDPSYAGQIVVMTYPQIGNYGIAPEDFESRQTYLSALIVKEPSRIASNWRHDRSLGDYLEARGVAGLSGFDTRALVRHLRSGGVQRGVIADEGAPVEALVDRARAVRSMAGCDLASEVTVDSEYAWREKTFLLPDGGKPPSRVAGAPLVTNGPGGTARRHRVAVLDFGVKWSILRRLADVGCDLEVLPATTPADEILARGLDGVVLSNGPGDPEPVEIGVRTARALIGRVPIFGICLGHQLLSLACGGRTYKLKFGHRGGNHPVMDLTTRKVEITSHNHGFSVDPDSLPDRDVELTHLNLNDQTLEGIRLRNAPAFSVQYHPEAAPGPNDARYLFERFTALMSGWRETGA